MFSLMEQDTTIQGLVSCFIVCFACRCLIPAGGEPAVQRGAGQSDAHWTAHGEGCQLQELQQQTGLDLRICHWGQSAVQGGPSHPGEGAGAGERGLWGARPVRQLMSPHAVSSRPRHSPSLALPPSLPPMPPMPPCCTPTPADLVASEVLASPPPRTLPPSLAYDLRPLLIRRLVCWLYSCWIDSSPKILADL